MTSGVFHSYPVSSISIPPDRQRDGLPDIEVLADSIRRCGLIHPILVSRAGELIAGRRRLAAVTSLGWTNVPVQFEDEEDPVRFQMLELEENIKRSDISWQDQCRAIRRYHKDRQTESAEWNQSDTAAALGISAKHIARILSVAAEIESGNVSVADAPTLTTAANIVERKQERARSAAVAIATETYAAPPRERLILNEDFNAWAPVYSGPKFNLIHCDFPYGINADKAKQGYAPGEFGGYSDTLDVYERLLETLVSNIDRIADEQCHLIFWFSMNHYDLTRAYLHKIFNLNPFPLIWLKSDGSGLLPDPQRGPRRVYETALLGSRGDRKIVRAVANATASAPSRDIHMSEKPRPMLEHFFRMLVDSSTALLDPTAGSGNALLVAKALGAHRVLGLEINPEFAERANERI